jgi:hypothetical protein
MRKGAVWTFATSKFKLAELNVKSDAAVFGNIDLTELAYDSRMKDTLNRYLISNPGHGATSLYLWDRPSSFRPRCRQVPGWCGRPRRLRLGRQPPRERTEMTLDGDVMRFTRDEEREILRAQRYPEIYECAEERICVFNQLCDRPEEFLDRLRWEYARTRVYSV